MDYKRKKVGASEYLQRTRRKRVFRRLSDLMYSRQISDEDIAYFLDIKLEFWALLKNGRMRPSDQIIEMLAELFGLEIYSVFMGYYVDNLLPEIRWANEI